MRGNQAVVPIKISHSEYIEDKSHVPAMSDVLVRAQNCKNSEKFVGKRIPKPYTKQTAHLVIALAELVYSVYLKVETLSMLGG